MIYLCWRKAHDKVYFLALSVTAVYSADSKVTERNI